MASKLAISFITYNRAKHMKEDLVRIAFQTQKKGITIHVFDGSTDKETELAVRKFIKRGYQHISYYHYGNEFEDIKQRVKDALLLPDVEYIWLCGDKFLVSPENYDEILNYIDLKYDMISIYDDSLHGTKSFVNPVEYVDYTIIPFTHIGAVIIRKDLLTERLIEKACAASLGYWHLILYCCCINKEDFHGVTIHAYGSHLYVPSKYNTKSYSKAHMWEIWIEDWYLSIMRLPSRYNKIKRALLNRPDKEVHFFSLKALLEQREEGQFDWKMCMRYRKYISRVICIPDSIVFIISCLPKKVAGLLRKIITEWENCKLVMRSCSTGMR